MITGEIYGRKITGCIYGSLISGDICEGLPAGVISRIVTGTASSVAVPDGAYGARFITDGAAVTKYQPKWTSFNQLWDFSYNGAIPTGSTGKTYSGVNFVRGDDPGIQYTINGTATAAVNITCTYTIPAGHKILVTGVPQVDKCYFRFYTNTTMEVPEDGIYSYTRDTTYHRFRISNGVTLENLLFVPCVCDLTDMFGEGNEPKTVAEFRKYFPAETYEYTTGTDSTTTITPSAVDYTPVCGGTISFYDSSEAAVETEYQIEFIGRLTE